MGTLAFGTKTVKSIWVGAFEFTVFPLLVHCTDGNTFSNLKPSVIFGVLVQAL